jgi:hypothetical protein
MKSIRITKTELETIQGYVLRIVQRNAPEEVDLVPLITTQVFQEVNGGENAAEPEEKMFSFTGSDELLQYLSGALSILLNLVVFPFLKKAYEKAIEKTAEKSIDSPARKLQDLFEKLKKKSDDPKLHQELDLLIPVNWVELNKELQITSRDRGLSAAEAKRISNMVVHDLKQDKVLMGDIVVYVSRVDIQKKQK